MKKKYLLLVLAALLLTGCAASGPTIESDIWIMSTVQTTDNDGQLIAYGAESGCVPDNAVPLALTCQAAGGIITLTDQTNGNTYTGTYGKTSEDPRSEIYEIAIGQTSGLAVVSETSYQDGTKQATLVIRLDQYSLNFFISQE